MKPVYLLLISLAIVCSCKESRKAANPNNDATQKVLTKEDSALKETIAIHDEVMPKMGKLIGYQKRAQQRLDSLEDFMMRARLTPIGVKSFNDKKDSLNHLIFDLRLSQKAMNDWMEQFVTEPKLPTTEERIAYFQDQKLKAQKMRDSFFVSMDKAKEMLGE